MGSRSIERKRSVTPFRFYNVESFLRPENLKESHAYEGTGVLSKLGKEEPFLSTHKARAITICLNGDLVIDECKRWHKN